MGRSTARGWVRQAVRWWYVLRYYRFSQLMLRLVNRGRGWILSRTGGRRYTRPASVLPKVRENAGFGRLLRWKLAHHAFKGAESNALRIARGNFRFLNQSRRMTDPVDWRLEGIREISRLWRFHLHYQEYLLDLAAEGLKSGGPVWFERAWRLVVGWIENNPPSRPRVFRDAWHPYCISRRLPAWILLWSASAPREAIGRQVFSSICSQARFLEDHLERDLGGNHLLENATALTLAGAFSIRASHGYTENHPARVPWAACLPLLRAADNPPLAADAGRLPRKTLKDPEFERWLNRGTRILQRELSKQILPHGEHFERSPMYHARMLEAVLDVRDALETLRPDVARLCHTTAARMARFLQAILHPDGEIPLLGDASLGATPPARQLVARTFGAPPPRTLMPIRKSAPLALLAGRGVGGEGFWDRLLERRAGEEALSGTFCLKGKRPTDHAAGPPALAAGPTDHAARPTDHAPGPTFGRCPARRCAASHKTCPESLRRGRHPGHTVGEYWIYRHGRDFLLLDAGPVGPDHLPAHAHADLLTLEDSVGVRRLFVDSGAFDYEDGPMRRYCRSSAAHNVLEIDDVSQCDTWSRFRMAYRGWPSGLESGRARGFHWARAHHNAYRRLGVPRVGRWIACRPGGPWFCVDRVEGTGRHKLITRLHLHPHVRTRKVAHDEVRLSIAGTALRLRSLTPAPIELCSGWYCPEFGRRLPCRVVQWSTEKRLPSACGWYLTWGERGGTAILDHTGSASALLRWREHDQKLQLSPW